jgi:beta-glucanase (GH16 family)
MMPCSKANISDSKPYIYVPPGALIDSNLSFDSTLNWSDEFATNGMTDTSKWTYDLGGAWGNSELEDYTNLPANISIDTGFLAITVCKQSLGEGSYTSMHIVPKGTCSMLYGRIDVRAKLPSGVGTWPAIWMLPDTYAYGAWQNSGEVDIMEMVGYIPNAAHFSAHNSLFYAANPKTSFRIETTSTVYHLYSENWTPYAIRGYYDNNLVLKQVRLHGLTTPKNIC